MAIEENWPIHWTLMITWTILHKAETEKVDYCQGHILFPVQPSTTVPKYGLLELLSWLYSRLLVVLTLTQQTHTTIFGWREAWLIEKMGICPVSIIHRIWCKCKKSWITAHISDLSVIHIGVVWQSGWCSLLVSYRSSYTSHHIIFIIYHCLCTTYYPWFFAFTCSPAETCMNSFCGKQINNFIVCKKCQIHG